MDDDNTTTNAKKRKRSPPQRRTKNNKGRARRGKKTRGNECTTTTTNVPDPNEDNPFLSLLPPEILTMIVCHLVDPLDISSVGMSCKKLGFIVSGEPSIWANLAKELGYDRGVTGADMNNLSKTYLVLWSVTEVHNSAIRHVPIVGLVHGVMDPVKLRRVPLTMENLRRFKILITKAVASLSDVLRLEHLPWAILELLGAEATEDAVGDDDDDDDDDQPSDKFEQMTSLSDKELLEGARAQWAIGPLGCRISHMAALEYATHSCVSVVHWKKMRVGNDDDDQPSRQIPFAFAGSSPGPSFEIEMCGMALTAIHSQLKQRAYYLGDVTRHPFSGVVTACPAAMEKVSGVVVEEMRKEFVERDAEENPWCSGALLCFHEKA